MGGTVCSVKSYGNRQKLFYKCVCVRVWFSESVRVCLELVMCTSIVYIQIINNVYSFICIPNSESIIVLIGTL